MTIEALPTEKTPPKTDFSKMNFFIYGPKGIGKSTLAGQFPDALIVDTQQGTTAFERYQQEISTWNDFKDLARLFLKGGHNYKTLVLDMVDDLYEFCARQVCDSRNSDHESDIGSMGKGFALVRTEFFNVMRPLVGSKYGLVVIAHVDKREIQTATGAITKMQPTLPGKTAEMMIGLFEVVLYCEVQRFTKDGAAQTRRVMHSAPGDTFEAGDRFDLLPDVAPLDYSVIRNAMSKEASE